MLRILAVSIRYPDSMRPGFGSYVERQMLELAARPGVEVVVASPLGRAPFPLSWFDPRNRFDMLPRAEIRGGLHVHRPRFAVLPRRGPTPQALARGLFATARRLHAEAPFDVITAEFSWPEGPAAAALGRALGLPVSIKARGQDFEVPVARPANRRRILAAGLEAAGLLAVSADVRSAMVAIGLPAERIKVHYPAVDTERFAIRDRVAAKAALRLDGPVLLTVGNLSRVKRQRLAIEALRHLPGATLVIAGSGPQEAALRQRALELGVAGRVRMMGSLPNALLPAFYNAADVLLHCSSVEGFANVRLESLACGTPVVTTAAGEAGRAITSSDAGRIVAADPGAMADAARELIDSPPDREATRRPALEFTWRRATDQFEAHLRALARVETPQRIPPGGLTL
jgi:teichuronic acid biosynthesis glycosyltransferase TuaC